MASRRMVASVEEKPVTVNSCHGSRPTPAARDPPEQRGNSAGIMVGRPRFSRCRNPMAEADHGRKSILIFVIVGRTDE
jgi:hypothetical protein